MTYLYFQHQVHVDQPLGLTILDLIRNISVVRKTPGRKCLTVPRNILLLHPSFYVWRMGKSQQHFLGKLFHICNRQLQLRGSTAFSWNSTSMRQLLWLHFGPFSERIKWADPLRSLLKTGGKIHRTTIKCPLCPLLSWTGQAAHTCDLLILCYSLRFSCCVMYIFRFSEKKWYISSVLCILINEIIDKFLDLLMRLVWLGMGGF